MWFTLPLKWLPLKYANKKKNYWNWTEFEKNAFQRNCYNNFYWNILSSHRHAFAFSLRVFNCFFFPFSFFLFGFIKLNLNSVSVFWFRLNCYFTAVIISIIYHFFSKVFAFEFARKQSQLPVASLNWQNNSLSLFGRERAW